MPLHKEDLIALRCNVQFLKSTHPYGWCLDTVRDLHLYRHVFARHEFGFAVTKDNELTHVYCNVKGNLDRVMRMAGWLNATWLTCYDTGLVEKYEAFGWRVVERTPFNPALCRDAPAGLTPDHVKMERKQ